MADVASSTCSFANVELNTVELPPSIEIRESSVISGGAGAFSKTLIPKDTRFGPYKGEIIMAGQKDYIDYRFAWEVFEKNSNDLKHTVSAMDSKTSNWMRHVNCARFFEEQNIISIQEGYSIFYVVMKDIKPGEELLTWFDPKLLKRTQRRLSKMERKPVGYTIELVPWSDEKKFVPEIIETKRARKKKVLRDMICLDEDPLALTRTLQRLSKLPCTSKQLAQSSLKRLSISEKSNRSLVTLKAASPINANALPKTKKGGKSKNPGMVKISQMVENKVNDKTIEKNGTQLAYQNLLENKDKLRGQSAAEKGHSNILFSKVFAESSLKTKKWKEVNNIALLQKNSMKVGRSKHNCLSAGEVMHDDVTVVKPIVIQQNEDGSAIVEDHDETYILHNMELRPECDDKCPCLDHEKCMKPSEKEKQDIFVIHFTLLPEHKSLSVDSKIIYRCDVCDNAYNHAFSLKRHYLSVHVNHRYLSRDDIVNCQIETFHTGIELESQDIEIGINTLSCHSTQEPSLVKTLTSITQMNSKGSESFMNKLQGTSAVKECRYMTCEESLVCKDKGIENVSNESQIFTTVPSLTSLAQISVDKIRDKNVTLLNSFDPVACEIIEHESSGVSLECNKSLDSELLCRHKSEFELCECAAETKDITELADLHHINITNCIESGKHSEDLLLNVPKSTSGVPKLNNEDTSPIMTYVFDEIKQPKKDSSSEVECVEQIVNCKAIQMTNFVATNVDKVLDLNSEYHCSGENVSKTVGTDSYVKSNSCSPTLCEMLPYKNSESIGCVSAEKGITLPSVKTASGIPSRECSHKLNMGKGDLKSAIMNNHASYKDTDKEMQTFPECVKSILGEVKTETPVANNEITSASVNQDCLTAVDAPISDLFEEFFQTFNDGPTVMDSFTAAESCDSFIPVADHLSSLANDDGMSASNKSGNVFADSCNVQGKQEDSDVGITLHEESTVCNTNIMCTLSMMSSNTSKSVITQSSSKTLSNASAVTQLSSITSSNAFAVSQSSSVTSNNASTAVVTHSSSMTSSTASTSSVVTHNQPAQQLIFVTNLVFPVVSTSQLQNTLSSLPSAVQQDESPMTHQTASVPLVVISPVSCGLQTMNNSFNVLNLENTLTGLSSSFPSSNKSSISNQVCGNSSLEIAPLVCDLTSAVAVGNLTSSSSFCAPGKPVNPSNENQGQHLLDTNTGSVKKVAITKISSLMSPKKSLSLFGTQPDDLYRCHMCVRLFKTLSELKQHIRNDPHRFKGVLKQYACLQCSMRFSNKNNLMRHNLMNHPDNENYKFRCFTCGKGYTSETYLKMHARFHSGKNFPCKYGCEDVYFPNAASLVKHLRSEHAGLDLKEYQRNAKVEKLHRKKSNCIFGKKITKLGSSEKTLETSKAVITSSFLDSLDQPGMGFQLQSGHHKGLEDTSEHFLRAEDSFIKTQNTLEPHISDDKKHKLRFQCHLCLKGFSCHLKLLQHRTQKHGAGQSVQEYLYQMSKETMDEELSETDYVKLELSPPPSPKTFFANVNRRGFENVEFYVDGNSKSLQFWQEHLVLKDSVPNSDSTLTAMSERKIEWTMFNFPPCFDYREDCTTFYDSATKADASHKQSNDLIEVEKKDTWEVHDIPSMKSDVVVNALCDTSKHSEYLNTYCVDTAYANVNSKEDSNCTDDLDESLCIANKLQQQSQREKKQMNNDSVSLLETENCKDIIGMEAVTAELVQNNMQSCDDLVNRRQEVYESGYPAVYSGVEDCVLKDGVFSNTVNNQPQVDSEYLCRLVVDEMVGNVVKIAKSLNEEKCNSHRSQSLFKGNSDIKGCLSEDLKRVQKLPEDCVHDFDNVPEFKDMKEDCWNSEYNSEGGMVNKSASISSKSFPTTFTELSAKEKLQVLKSQCIQGINLEMSEPKQHNNVIMCLIDALDLHILKEQCHRIFTDVKNASCLLKTRGRTVSLESRTVISQNEQFDRHFDNSPDNSHNNSDSSRHDHRRYSIWTGLVHQKFDTGSKKEICQPVTEAVRKQEILQLQTKYQCEKSARAKEMFEKHNKIAQKFCFAESLGLMTRAEFAMSYHAQKHQEFVIKAPEIWRNYENIWFGKKGNIAVVCSICHRHFSCWDLCLRHQLKKHPHIEPASLEMEKDNFVEDMYYYYPMPYGILAQTHLIPDNLPSPEVYVCTKCGFPFKNLNRLHAHIIICDPALEEATSNQNDSLKRPSYMKKKLLPMMDRRLYMEQPKIKVKNACVSTASIEVKQNRSLHSHGKRSKLASDDKSLSSVLQGRLNYSVPFSFYLGRKRKNYELFYNPQNHTRHRERYKVLDQHQCHGCNLKFNSLYMLEKHVNKCSGRDKLQSQKPLLSGIMRDDAALRKQHTCRYCSKRFTYIKGVDLHYKRICAVRKVKEEENQLTEEDLAHEAELKKIIEHIKWSKSFNKDSSDIIQGHVKVEEDGTLTRVVKQRSLPQSLKKKMKKKGFKWTALKRHRPDDEMTSASDSTQSSPVVAEVDGELLADIKVPEKFCEVLDTGGLKRLTRSTSHELVYQKHVTIRKRELSPEGGPVRKKGRTVSQSSKNDDTGRHCKGRKGKLKKCMFSEKVFTSEVRQNKQTLDNVKYIRINDSERSVHSVSSPKASCRTVTATLQTSRVDIGNKPPARKRGKPKRFDPSDMESSYKKKKKCDQGYICHQMKVDGAKNDFSERKVNSNMSTAVNSHKKQRAGMSVQDKEPYVLRKKSLQGVHDSTSYTEVNICGSKYTSSNKEKATKGKEDQHFESNNLFAKMKQLKEAVKSERSKLSQRRKLSSSFAIKKISSTEAVSIDCFHRKDDLERKSKNKYSKPVNKAQSSSELLKHLTKDEEKTLGKNSPEKPVMKGKGTASVSIPVESTTVLKQTNICTPVKCLKITMQKTSSKTSAISSVPFTEASMSTINSVSAVSGLKTVAKRTVDKAACQFEDGESTNTYVDSELVTSPIITAPLKTFSKSANILKNNGVSNVPSFQGISSKTASLISKQPVVSVRVVTLSPNGTNLRIHDSSASIPQPSVVLAKSAEATQSVSLPNQKVLNSLPQGCVQLSIKSSTDLQPEELQTIFEQGNKISTTEKQTASNSKSYNIIQSGHAQAVNTSIKEESNIGMKKSIVQDFSKSFAPQKGFAKQAQVSDNLVKQELVNNICEFEKHEIVHSLTCAEKQISDVRPNMWKDIELRTSPKDKKAVTISNSDNQIALKLIESAYVKSPDQVIIKPSVKYGVKHSVDDKITLLCRDDHILQKQMHQTANIDQTSTAKQNQSVASSILHTVTKTLPNSQCQIKEASKSRENNVRHVSNIACSVSSSKLKCSNIMSVPSTSLSNVHVAHSRSQTNSHETVSAIIVSSTSVKSQAAAPEDKTPAAAKLTLSTKYGNPAKLVTLTGTVIPNFLQGNVLQTGKRMLKISNVNGTNSCMTSAHQQAPSINVQCRRMPTVPHIIPTVVAEKPILLSASELPRLLTTGVHLQHSSMQQSATQCTTNQSVQTDCAPQLLKRTQPAKNLSQQICILQSTVVNNKVIVAQPSDVSSIVTSGHTSSMKANKISSNSVVAVSSNIPVTSQIMFSLEDGTTAMLDPDSLAQFLSTSPSLNKLDLCSVASVACTGPDHTSTVVLNTAESQPNQQNLEEISWPASGSIDLTELPDSLNKLE